MFAFLMTTLPAFSATLRGVIKDQDGYPISGAKVVIFHEMAMVLVQRAVCDRRGQYQFNMEPGPYRIFVLKKGYLVAKNRVMILHEKEMVELPMQLLSEAVDPNDQSAKNLKRILRRENRGPRRDLVRDTLIQAGMTPVADDSLVGELRTHSRQSLDGGSLQSATFSVNARLNRTVALESELTQDQQNDTTRFKAGVSVNLRSVALDVKAQTISADRRELGRSRGVQITGSYSEQIRTATSLGYRESETMDQHQQELKLEQNLSYSLARHAFRHELQFTDWEQDQDALATHALLTTEWAYEPADAFGLRSDLDVLDLPRGRNLSTRLWLTADQRFWEDRLTVDSAVGVHREDSQNDLVQNYHVAWQPGPMLMQIRFQDSFAYRPFASYDVFGVYLERSVTPNTTEGFYRTQNRVLAASAALSHGNGMVSSLNWSQQRNRADLLSQRTDSVFLNRAGYQAQSLAYVLEAEQRGILLELSYAENESHDRAFDHTQLAYAQTLQSFQEKGLGLMFEFHLKNQPDLPAWWLLESIPWDAEDESLWYEGRLSLQF